MKKLLRLFLVGIFAMLSFSACSDDDDPRDNDLFIGTYDGRISYVKPGTNISKDNGHVRVEKIGDRYNFIFSDGIPDIRDVELRDNGDGWSTNSNHGPETSIRINAHELDLYIVDGDETWNANCHR